MIAVFWLEWSPAGGAAPRHENFDASQLAEALRFAESLRRRRREGEPISHVAIQSELPQAVGEAGVKDAPADYAHYKRRLDPAIPLGRPSGGRRGDRLQDEPEDGSAPFA